MPSQLGKVRVSAKAVNGHFAVSVTDTGPGIPEQEQARIFEQFHQVDSSLTKAKGGTGLGLAIAKQIVEMHGGRIWVESTLGKGSTFLMELPTRAQLVTLSLIYRRRLVLPDTHRRLAQDGIEALLYLRSEPSIVSPLCVMTARATPVPAFPLDVPGYGVGYPTDLRRVGARRP